MFGSRLKLRSNRSMARKWSNDMGAITNYKLKTDLPYLPKGSVYGFDESTGDVYAIHKGNMNHEPLRHGLAGYLWLLRNETKKHFRKMKD